MKRIPKRLRHVGLVLGALGLAGCGANLMLRYGNSTSRDTSDQTYGGVEIVYEHASLVVLQRDRDKIPLSPHEWNLALCRARIIDEFCFLFPVGVNDYELHRLRKNQFPYHRQFKGASHIPEMYKFHTERQIPKSLLEFNHVSFHLDRLYRFVELPEHPGVVTGKIRGFYRAATSSLSAVVALQSSTERDVANSPVKALKLISRAGTPGHPQNLIAVAVNTPYWTMVLDMANSTNPRFLEQATVISEVANFGTRPHKILKDLLRALSTIELPNYMKGPDNGPKFLEKLETISLVEDQLRKPGTCEVTEKIKQIIDDIIHRNRYCDAIMRIPEPNFMEYLASIINFEFILCDPRIENEIRALPQDRKKILYPPENPGAASDSADFDQVAEQRFAQDSAACNLVIDKIRGIVHEDKLGH